jgi:uncharacterized membrane protein YhhN
MASLELIGRLMTDALWLNFSKPLLIPTLMMLLSSYLPFHFNGRLFIYLALIFSAIGDVFLMFDEQIMFLSGLGSFALAHLFFIIFFVKQVEIKDKAFKPLIIIPMIGYISFLIYTIYNYLGDLKPFVIGYAIIIATMLYAVVLLKNSFNSSAYLMTVIGALFFIVSDSLLALNMFGHAFKFAGFWVMFTYIIAQFLIIRGIIFQYEKKI